MHTYQVTPGQPFDINNTERQPPANTPSDDELKNQLSKTVKSISRWQRKLYAQDEYAMLLVFQAMDAAGKDSTIRHVLSGVNPAGCQVYSFKKPSSRELDHDFLWRTASRMPQRGRIGVFNRSYYEEVLVVRVHPEYLNYQRLPVLPKNDAELEIFWQQRFDSINDHEQHLVRNGTVVLKFFLNVSLAEQQRRFLSRIDNPGKNWKFESADIAESELWDDYMHAYQACLNATSTEWAPWHAIPADNKDYMRLTVANVIEQKLASLNVNYPASSDTHHRELQVMRASIESRLKGL
ncbi:MAG: polyphosphate kinase 2 family protein [Gammaproteobacteria bacterium]|nr:polyphosphate kinase 2 family protein [Gammaproteobacteria bacterium]